MRRVLLVLVISASLLTSGCGKKGFFKAATSPEFMIGTTLAALAGGFKYVGSSRRNKNKKRHHEILIADSKKFDDYKNSPCCIESHRYLQ